MSRRKVIEKPYRGEKFGTQANKSKHILVFRNGDKFHKGEKVTLGRKFKDMNQLMTYCSGIVRLSSGAVRKLVTPSGKKLTSLSAFKEGGRYIAIGGEMKINKTYYPLALKKKGGVKKKKKEPQMEYSSTPVKRKAVVKKKYKGEKFGVQARKAMAIHVFRNGDKHDKGTKITINPKRILNMDQLKEKINELVALGTPCRRLYTFPGHKVVKSLKSLKDGKRYIGVGGELKINKTYYPYYLTKLKQSLKKEKSRENLDRSVGMVEEPPKAEEAEEVVEEEEVEEKEEVENEGE